MFVIGFTMLLLCTGPIHGHSEAEEDPLQLMCRNRCKHDVYGACYLSHPQNCQKYVRCVFDQFNFVNFYVYVYDCPFGTFFSERKTQCDHSYNVNCPNDPCKISDTLTYDHKVDVGISNCRSHWFCRDGKSFFACCASGHAYIEGQGCVKDPMCRDHCYSENTCVEPEPGPTCRSYFNCSDEGTFTPSCCQLGHEYHTQRQICIPNPRCTSDCDAACPYKKVFGNNKSFLHGGKIKICPVGTIFREDICACALDNDYHPNGDCKAKVDLSFAGIDIGSPHLSYFGIEDKLGVGHFRNNSHIEVPLYDHGSDINNIFVELKFKLDDHQQDSAVFQVLLSNCRTFENAKQPTPSIQIVLNRLNEVMIFSGLTTNGDSGVFELSYERDQWNHVILEFDGNTMRAKIVPESNAIDKQYDGEIALTGRLRPSVSGLSIGGCAGLTDRQGNDLNIFFHGEMDDIKIYTGCMPKTMQPL